MKHLKTVEIASGLAAYPYLTTAQSAAIVSHEINWRKIDFVDANITSSSKYENNHTLYTHKLSLNVGDSETQTIPDTPIFRITDTSGNRFLVGNGRRPWPIPTPAATAGHKGDTDAKQTVDITLTCHYDLFKLLN